jgi:sigma-B regulation protein RsbU (phosphoserine phosphatase)
MHTDNLILTAADVLNAFRRDQVFLFFGAAFFAAGTVSLAFSAMRRNFNSLFFWFGLFAICDGGRLWLQSETVTMLMGSSALFDRFRYALDYIGGFPLLLFFQASGFLSRRLTKVAYALAVMLCCLLGATLLFGSLPVLYRTHAVVVSVAVILLIVDSLRNTTNGDFSIMRFGLLLYVVSLLCTYIAGLWGMLLRSEPFGTLILLGSLGYVAAQQTLSRDRHLNAIRQELNIAMQLQRATLPEHLPASDHFQVVTRYLPMTAVAGDMYDFLVADEHQVGLLIADVSGHGIAAALICSMVKLASSISAAHAKDPSELLSRMNAILCGNTQGQFVTAAYAYINTKSEEMYYSAAGHPPMLVLRHGRVSAIEANGLLLAAFPFAQYKTITYPLEPGDRILLYTDGIVESADAGQNEFGRDRLCALLENTAKSSLSETADIIIKSVQEWSLSQNDDLTLVLCDYKCRA